MTCESKHPWDGALGIMQAGHFYPARFDRSATKFCRVNIHTQCRQCNTMPRTVAYRPYAVNAVVDVAENYREWMLQHYGQETVTMIRNLEREVLGWTVETAVEFRADCLSARKAIESARESATEWDPWAMIGVFTPEVPLEVRV